MGVGIAEHIKMKLDAKGDKKPDALFWINIGYQQEVDTDEGTEQRFISLAFGIPLDTQEILDTSKGTKAWRDQQAARNDLREQLLKVAATLQPGEERIVGTTEVGLQIQLRRVKDAKPETARTENPFIRRLAFA
jgi:hypothetical protein